MTTTRLRPIMEKVSSPFVSLFRYIGITPNVVSLSAFILAGIASRSIYLSTTLGYLAAAVLVGLSGFLDIVDGELARETGKSSDRGDYLDHVLDRYSDFVIILGITAGMDRWLLGVLALSGVYLTSYMGTQAQAVGAGRQYSGLLGRADRLILVMAALILQILSISIYGYPGLTVLLALFAVAGNLTAMQRFVQTWLSLGDS